MGRTILAVIGGVLAWMLVVAVLNIGLRQLLPGYAEAEPTLAFTLPMMFARLAMAAIVSIVAGMATGWIAPASKLAPWIVATLLLVVFVPIHVKLWSLLPAWYHLFFLITLPPLVALGARLRLPGRRTERSGAIKA